MQAQTVLRRMDVAEHLWADIGELLEQAGLPDRAAWALFDAASGLRVRRAGYARDAGLEPATAARDLRMLASAELLEPQGETRARVYVATPRVRELRTRANKARRPLLDPYEEEPRA
jgi:hypothetical protein